MIQTEIRLNFPLTLDMTSDHEDIQSFRRTRDLMILRDSVVFGCNIRCQILLFSQKSKFVLHHFARLGLNLVTKILIFKDLSEVCLNLDMTNLQCGKFLESFSIIITV